ncbi:MAG: fused MFS/spermidine synthase [Thermoanaerobaculia bacterium]
MSPGRRSAFWKRTALLAVFTFSGASGLVYEVLWTRRLTHIFGSTTLAVSTVLAAFMGGLAAGSYLLGAWADRHRDRALRTYGLLEIAIGILALAVPTLLKAVEAVYLAVAPALERVPMAFFVVQFVLVGLVLILPCVLMGGTLPILARWLVGREEEIGARVGGLYAANTLGAAIGTGSATYFLLPRLGVREGELVAVAINLAAGLVALAMARRARTPAVPAPDSAAAGESPDASLTPTPDRAGRVLIATALAGFACMVDEVAWARLVSLVFGSSVYAFGLMLLQFLGGMAIGSAIYSRIRRWPARRVLGIALCAGTGAALIGIASVPRLPLLYMRGFPAVRDSFWLVQLWQILETAPVLLPLAISFGVAFPAAIAAIADVGRMGRGVGRVTVWNTVGTVGGAFLAGFVLVPRFGLRPTLTLAAAAAGIAAILVILPDPSPRFRRFGAAAPAAALAAALLLPAWPLNLLAQGAGFYAAIYETAQGLRDAEQRSELLFYEDGIATTLSVDRQGAHRFYRSNGKTDASTDPGDMANQLLLGHLPMLAHLDPKDVFVLGLGTGVSAAAIARYPVRSIDIADIESGSREATKFFAQENRNILADPRVTFLVADGRNALLARKKTYDVILSDPSDVWVAGVGNLFTREFYALARSRLRPGGVMVQWFHGHSLPPEQMKLIVATFRSVFPHASFWRPNRGDVILMGTVEPTPWDLTRLRERVASVPGVRDDLLSMGFWHPLAIFAPFVLDGDDLARMVSGVEGLHSDNHPVIEYLSPRAGYDDTTPINDAGVQALQTKRLPAIAGFEEARDFDARARYLLGFAMASIGRTDPAIELMEDSVDGPVQDAKFLVGLGNQYRLKGWNGKAIAAYERALVVDPADTEAALHLVETRRSVGDDAGAEQTLQAALARTRDDAELARAAARLLLETGRGAEAVSVVAPALEKEPGNAALRLLSGEALAAAGRAPEASAALRQASSAASQDPALQREAGAALFAIGDVEGARAAYALAVSLEPENVAGLVGLADVEYRRGDLPAARIARDRALALDPYNSAALAMK